MVQPGIVSNAVTRVDASERLTAELSRSGELSGVRPDLIVWGESSTAVDLTLPQNRGQLARMQALARAGGADLLVNQDTTVPGQGQEKVGVLISPSGIEGQYIKTRLVPFGEYIPFRQQLGWLTKISKAAASNMIPGTGAHLLYPDDRAGRPLPIGVLICFESAFPDMARADVQRGAQLIVYQTSDSTFQASWELAQHASLVAVRAAETGRPAVQAALTGDSAAFDAQGRLLAWTSGGFRGARLVRLSLPPAGYRTPFDRYGPYASWICVITVVVTGLLAAGRAGRRNRAAGRGFTRIRGRGYPESATSGVDRTSVQ